MAFRASRSPGLQRLIERAVTLPCADNRHDDPPAKPAAHLGGSSDPTSRPPSLAIPSNHPLLRSRGTATRAELDIWDNADQPRSGGIGRRQNRDRCVPGGSPYRISKGRRAHVGRDLLAWSLNQGWGELPGIRSHITTQSWLSTSRRRTSISSFSAVGIMRPT
jgi:hypothetical protein